MIQLSQGTASLNIYTRRIKKEVEAQLFAGAEVNPSTMEMSTVPMVNMLKAKELLLERILDKIEINGVTYTYKDIDTLEQEGKLTSQDIGLIEDAVETITSGENVKKKL